MNCGLFITGRCGTNCLICALKGKALPKIHHIGKTKTEQKGLQNLLLAIENENLGITGGDPLQNELALEYVLKYHSENTSIIINPLSLFASQLGIEIESLTKNIVKSYTKKSSDKTLSPKTSRHVELLKGFGIVSVSDGNAQSPNNWLMEYAKDFFYKKIEPILKSNGCEVRSNSVDALMFTDKVMLGSPELKVVGNLYSMIENDEYNRCYKRGIKEIEKKDKICRADDFITMYFQKESGIARLYYGICCSPGATNYTSFKTRLSLEDFAFMQPKDIRKKIVNEEKRLEKTALYKLLNTDEDKRIDEGFLRYIQYGDEFLSERMDKKISVMKNVFSNNKKARYCEVCYTLGVLLEESKAMPEEWQSYLNNRY